MNRRLYAFTLVEVLVCIVIIVILAALIMSASRKSVSAAKGTVCQLNLKQVHLALSLYEEDQGMYPPWNNLRYPGLLPYFKESVPRCPTARPYVKRGDWGFDKEDYVLNVNWPDLFDQKPALLKCMEKRGPDWPVALDYNHSNPVRAVQQNQSETFVYLIRRGGSVHKTKLSNSLNPEPCPGLGTPINL
jgi:prepilin-type N-terminal cleavage/methylation domain-containing protein